LAHPGTGEPAEARLEEVLIAERLEAETSAQVRAALVAASLHVGAAAGASVARAEVNDEDLVATLHGAGFEVVDRIRYYSPPPTEPFLAATAAGVSVAF
jgi:hypothetical protein